MRLRHNSRRSCSLRNTERPESPRRQRRSAHEFARPERVYGPYTRSTPLSTRTKEPHSAARVTNLSTFARHAASSTSLPNCVELDRDIGVETSRRGSVPRRSDTLRKRLRASSSKVTLSPTRSIVTEMPDSFRLLATARASARVSPATNRDDSLRQSGEVSIQRRKNACRESRSRRARTLPG